MLRKSNSPDRSRRDGAGKPSFNRNNKDRNFSEGPKGPRKERSESRDQDGQRSYNKSPRSESRFGQGNREKQSGFSRTSRPDTRKESNTEQRSESRQGRSNTPSLRKNSAASNRPSFRKERFSGQEPYSRPERDNQSAERRSRPFREERPSRDFAPRSEERTSRPRFRSDNDRTENRPAERRNRPFREERPSRDFTPRSEERTSRPRFRSDNDRTENHPAERRSRPFREERPSRDFAPRSEERTSRPRFRSDNDRPQTERFSRNQPSTGRNFSFGLSRQEGDQQGGKRIVRNTDTRTERGQQESRPTYERGRRNDRFSSNDTPAPYSSADERKSRGSDRRNRGAQTPDYEFIRDRKKREQLERNIQTGEPSDMIRLNRYIANAGICSRREADKLILNGMVYVNGELVTELGHKIRKNDKVTYKGKQLRPQKQVYVLLNKPKGFLTTVSDPQERRTVMQLVANACEERIYPIGRLDRNTTGLLLFTNDGDLAKKMAHPSSEVQKIYLVQLDKGITHADESTIINRELVLEDGPVEIDGFSILNPERTLIGVELHSGKNRIVRRIFEHFGYEVVKLDRTVYAGLTKADLARGRWRYLSEKEVIQLKYFTGKTKNKLVPPRAEKTLESQYDAFFDEDDLFDDDEPLDLSDLGIELSE